MVLTIIVIRPCLTSPWMMTRGTASWTLNMPQGSASSGYAAWTAHACSLACPACPLHHQTGGTGMSALFSNSCTRLQLGTKSSQQVMLHFPLSLSPCAQVL